MQFHAEECSSTIKFDSTAVEQRVQEPCSVEKGGNVRVSFIDVGKGDCILLQSGQSAALIDTGYDRTSNEVLSFLRERGVDHLELLIITHYDRDHVGGVRAIGSEIAIDMVYLPAYEGVDKNYRTLMSAIETLGLPTRRIDKTLPLQLGDAHLSINPSGVTFVPDAKGDEGNDNDLSLVTSLTCGADTFILTGDLEKDGIEAYLNVGYGRFDVLKVPCHGEKCSCTVEFLEDVQPQIAIITDSVDDPAAKKTLKLLAEKGIDTYRTSVDGTIVVQGDGAGNYTVSC